MSLGRIWGWPGQVAPPTSDEIHGWEGLHRFTPLKGVTLPAPSSLHISSKMETWPRGGWVGKEHTNVETASLPQGQGPQLDNCACAALNPAPHQILPTPLTTFKHIKLHLMSLGQIWGWPGQVAPPTSDEIHGWEGLHHFTPLKGVTLPPQSPTLGLAQMEPHSQYWVP